MIGQTLGHYRIVEKVGEGGMGVVYRAQDVRLERDVALKVLRTGVLADEGARKRFRKEALALSKLNHPNIATVHDFDTQGGLDFLTMEFVVGEPLSHKTQAGPLPEKEIVSLGTQMAAALEAAHEHEIVHRDLKPGNIMITPKGQVKLLDFGLAKVVQPVAAMTTADTLNETVEVAGTVPYMAPEQLQGESVDARSDFFSFGAVLYEMATGQRPFREKTLTRLTDAILHQASVSPRALNARISPELERVILKCLEKQPEHRYQSAKEIVADLRRLASGSQSIAPSATPAKAPYGSKGLKAASIGVLVVVALALLSPMSWRGRLFSPGAAAQVRSLAVLPLENFSRDPDQDFFADGMTEALITDLSKISALRVISRTSVMQYKGAKKPLPQIARELQVDAVIEGSVERAGDRVRITAQLIDAVNDKHLWAERYDRDVGDVLLLQGEISRTIADEIRIKLTPQQGTQLAKNPRVDPQVQEDYLKGRYHLNKGSEEEIRKGIQFFEDVLTRNPKDARGYAGLADSYVALSDSYVAPSEILPKAKATSLKALELDDNLAEAHTSSGVVRFLYDWDWAGAEIEFKRAIELNPSSADAHVWYGVFLAQMDRGSEAIAELKRAEALDPLSLSVHVNAGWVYYLMRQNEQAIEQWRKALDLEPQFAVSHSAIWVGYLRSPDFAKVMAALGKGTSVDDPMELAALGGIYAVSGDSAQARSVLTKLSAMSTRRYVCPYEMATAHAVLGDKDQAIAYLRRGYQEHSGCIPDIKTDPRLDALRSDPRFQELLRSVGFPP